MAIATKGLNVSCSIERMEVMDYMLSMLKFLNLIKGTGEKVTMSTGPVNQCFCACGNSNSGTQHFFHVTSPDNLQLASALTHQLV